MGVVQTVFVFVLIPAGLYSVIALLTLWPNSVYRIRYRPGQRWTYPPVWWSAKARPVSGHTADRRSAGRDGVDHGAVTAPVRTARGGASGRW